MINVMGDSFGAAIVYELSKAELAKTDEDEAAAADGNQSKLALEDERAEEQV